MFYSAVPQGTHGNPKIVCGLRTHPRSAPNLERHGSSKMQTFGWLEMPHFLNRISRCIPSEIGRMCFFSYYFSLQKGLPVSRDCPSFSAHRKMLPIQQKTDIIDKEQYRVLLEEDFCETPEGDRKNRCPVCKSVRLYRMQCRSRRTGT